MGLCSQLWDSPLCKHISFNLQPWKRPSLLSSGHGFPTSFSLRGKVKGWDGACSLPCPCPHFAAVLLASISAHLRHHLQVGGALKKLAILKKNDPALRKSTPRAPLRSALRVCPIRRKWGWGWGRQLGWRWVQEGSETVLPIPIHRGSPRRSRVPWPEPAPRPRKPSAP